MVAVVVAASFPVPVTVKVYVPDVVAALVTVNSDDPVAALKLESPVYDTVNVSLPGASFPGWIVIVALPPESAVEPEL